MKIQSSDTRRFLQFTRKFWESTFEDDSPPVVFTFTANCYSIAMAKDGLLLTYLCNRVDSETSEQVIAVPIELLRDCLDGNGVVDLQLVVENGESYVVAAWNDGLVQCERNYPAQDPPDDHLIPDLTWHTVDERMVRTLRSPEKHSNQEGRAPSHRLARRPIGPIATAAH